jgi:hypothetical protein
LEKDYYFGALGSYDRVYTQVAKSTHYQPRFGGENVFLKILFLA